MSSYTRLGWVDQATLLVVKPGSPVAPVVNVVVTRAREWDSDVEVWAGPSPEALGKAAYDLSTMAAVVFTGGTLTADYLRGLREKIEAVQAMVPGGRGGMKAEDGWVDAAIARVARKEAKDEAARTALEETP